MQKSKGFYYMFKTLIFLINLLLISNALAHCPGHFAPEKVCFMLDQNLIYIYNEKFEHNGPYQDLKTYQVSHLKNADKKLEVTKKARGIFEIKSDKKLTEIEIELVKEKNRTVLKLKQE